MTGKDIAMLCSLIELADAEFDGHLTIMKFTTNWRVQLGTPEQVTEMGDEDWIVYPAVDAMPAGATLEEAARAAMRRHAIK